MRELKKKIFRFALACTCAGIWFTIFMNSPTLVASIVGILIIVYCVWVATTMWDRISDAIEEIRTSPVGMYLDGSINREYLIGMLEKEIEEDARTE